MTTSTNWFEVDKKGLSKLLEGRSKSAAVFELVQNALDTNATECHVVLSSTEVGRGLTDVVVEDDDPDGFKNLAHAFTLFAESDKKNKAEKRGRFNLGEKLVLALCTQASIETTTGTVSFDSDGRRHSRRRRAQGSRFSGLMRMNIDERDAVVTALHTLLVPPTCKLFVNGDQVVSRDPLATIEATLQTEIGDEEGVLRKSRRKTTVRVYEPRGGETPHLYEMGIPVVEHDCRWHVDISQKIPLTMQRDSAPPAFLREVRALVVNAMHERLSTTDAASGWVRDAMASPDAEPEAVNHVLDLRFGTKRVAFDPSDAEANKLAVVQGYTVVHGGSMSAGEWENARRTGAILPAGQVTPSPKPFSPEGKPLVTIPRAEWTRQMRDTAKYIRYIGGHIIGGGCVDLLVTIANDPGWGFNACYSPHNMNLTLNLAALGEAFFAGGLAGSEDVDRLLLHEFAHHECGDHLDHRFHEEICRLGAKMHRMPAFGG